MQTLLLAVWLMGLGTPSAPPTAPQDVGTALKMREIAKRVVAETGEQIIGLGSWISQANYRDPLKIAAGSDHDMRLLLPRGTTEEVARQRWQAVRQALVRNIEKEFGPQAPKVLASTNFYAPAQLMRGVEDTADAMGRFVEMKQVPNLGYKGAVTSSTPMHLAEGLYGEGAAVYTQGYERTAGRLFYQQKGKVYEGFTDLTHLGEGQARYTIGGAAHTAGEWVLHADDALKASNSSSLAKYLARLDRDLTKARDLARLPTGTSTSGELKALAARLKGGEAVADLRPAIEALLRRAHLESALVGRFGRAGALQRAVLRVAVDGVEAANSLGKALSAAAEKVPPERVVEGLMIAATTYACAKYAGEGEYHAAVASAIPAALGLAPGVLAMAAQAAIDAAREGGYDLVGGRQDAFDLLEGIFSANGTVTDTKYTLDQLVSQLATEAQLQAFVLARAQQAAARGFGDANGRHDLGTADAIFARCYPVILAAWRDKRDALQVEFTRLYEELEAGAVLLTYDPNPAPVPKQGAQTTVTVGIDTFDPKDGDRMARMRAILDTLYGARQGTFANVHTTWTPSGQEANYDNQRRFSFSSPGKNPVDVEQTLSFGATGLPKGSPMSGTITRKAMVEIDLGVGEKPSPPAEPAGGQIAGQFPATPVVGLSVTYVISGLALKKVIDSNDEFAMRRIQARVPRGPVSARGTVKFAGQNVVYGPVASARVSFSFIYAALKPGTDAEWAKRAASLKAAGIIPKEFDVAPGGQLFHEWNTNASRFEPGGALAFDFATDLSWIARLPKDLAGEFALSLNVEAGLNDAARPNVQVLVSGSGN